jgi:hypothetical protein
MTAELGQLGRDASQRVAQTLLHRRACALGRSTHATLATTQADGRGQLLGQSLDLGLDRIGARDVGDRLRIVELVAQLEQSRAVLLQGARVDDRARVTVVVRLGSRARQLQHVQLLPRALDQRGQQREATHVLEPHDFTAPRDRPVVALAAQREARTRRRRR